MSNDYQQRNLCVDYPHLCRKDILYEERIRLYTDDLIYNKGAGMCACGRSPRDDGKCVGFHKLSETEWSEKKDILIETYINSYKNVSTNDEN
jgi:hypothetical protein